MKIKTWTFIFALLISSVSVFAQQGTQVRKPPLILTSTAFPDGGIIPDKFTQAAPGAAPGGGASPQLNWTNVPEGTQSFVLYMHDLDVAINKTTHDNLHWIVWNIPAGSTSLAEGLAPGSQLPDGSYQINGSTAQYRGPGAPASGPLHHYVFELYALDIKLDVKPAETGLQTKINIFNAMEGHVIGKAAYVGLFKRPQ